MPTLRGPNPTNAIQLARDKVIPWRTAREIALQLYRDDKTPIEEIARIMRTSDQWVRKWIARFLDGGKQWAALENRSTRPHTIHTKRHTYTEQILEAKKKHPHLGALKLKLVDGIELCHTAIHQVLAENDLVKFAKKTWRKIRRFQRPTSNYMWQLDITQVASKDEGWVFILTILDDHSRFVLASRTFDKELTTADVILVVGEAIKQWGKPKQLLTDRGCQFHINSDDPSIFTLWLHGLGIQHIKARPRHPRTLGKIERWHRSLKEWLDHQAQPRNRAEMHGLLHRWVTHYNNERPHWALGNQVPLEAFIQGGFMSDEAVARLVNEVA